MLSFYGWWQIAVCLFAFLALMAIWWHIGWKQNDYGQIWLALSILCWSFSGIAEVYYANTGLESTNQIKQLEGWRSIFSLLNSLFILVSLPWFRYIPKSLEPLIKSKYWRLIIGVPFLFSLLPTLRKLFIGEGDSLISELDVYYSFFTLIFLGYVLWESFSKRRLKALAYLSMVCILVTLIAQLYKLTDSSVDLLLFSAIFKTTLIMIFFALALSWVKELTEQMSISSEQLFLRFQRQKTEKGKYKNEVAIKGVLGNTFHVFPLSYSHYQLLLKFAERKTETTEDWLEIKPKSESRPTKNYDINDHNEIKRLLIALLDGLFGKGLWSKNQHEVPLKKALFEMSEKRERKIRLLIPKENINLLTTDH